MLNNKHNNDLLLFISNTKLKQSKVDIEQDKNNKNYIKYLYALIVIRTHLIYFIQFI